MESLVWGCTQRDICQSSSEMKYPLWEVGVAKRWQKEQKISFKQRN